MAINYKSPNKKSASGRLTPKYGTSGAIITTPKPSYGANNPVMGGSNENQAPSSPTPTTPTYGALGGYKVDTTPVQVAPSGGYGFSNGHLTQEGEQKPPVSYAGGTPSNGNSETPSTENVTIPSTPMTYREFLENEKNKAIQAAEAERQRVVVDANAAYEQNKATYGANAEALRKQGMTGSGYSDYIDSQAYATSRGEEQRANVLAAQAKEKANTTYAENMIKLQEKEETEKKAAETEKNEKYVGLMAEAGKGTYTVDQLRQFGATYGLSEEQITQIVNEANKYNSNAQNKTYQSMITDENTSIFSINAAASAGTITQEQAQQLIGNIQNNNYLAFSYEISSGDAFDPDAVRIALKAGELTQEQVDKLKEEYLSAWNKEHNSSTYFQNKTQDIAKSELEIIETDPWITDEIKDKFVWEYNAIFNPSANASTETNGSTPSADVSDIKSGENGYVNIYDSNYSSSHFGDFYDTGKSGTKQENLVDAYVNDIKNKKVQIGDICIFNYGNYLDDAGAYIYEGNGVLRKIEDSEIDSAFETGKVYIPDGYKRDGYGCTLKEK